MYADYEYYESDFYGDKIDDEAFPKYAMLASDFIDYMTMGRAANNADLPAVKKCCCALAEQYQTIDAVQKAAAAKVTEDGIIASESVGSHSRSFRNGVDGALTIVETSDVHGHFFPYDFVERKPLKPSEKSWQTSSADT